MTHDDRFVRSVADWLDDQVGPGTPGYLDDVLDRTRLTRQRHWWSSLERWLPMDTTLRLVPTPRLSLLMVVIALLAALAAIVAVVGSQARLPPFGLADNGAVLYGSKGDIFLMTPEGDHKTIIAGSTNDFAPYFSRDGSKFAFLRATGGPGRMALMLANADGSNVHPLSETVDDVSGAEWSPDGSQIAVASRIDNKPSLWTVDVATGTETVLVSEMRAESIAWMPNGSELIFRGDRSEPGIGTSGLYRVGVDGSDLRPIVQPGVAGQFQEPALSPDGTKIIYTQWDGDAYAGGHLYVVDVGGGEPQRLWFDNAPNSQSDYFAVWSPDGTKIVFNRGTAQEAYHLSVAPAGGGAVIALGPELPWDAAVTAAFSPDGSKVIARYNNGETWIFNAGGGQGQRLDVATAYLMSWQRVAR